MPIQLVDLDDDVISHVARYIDGVSVTRALSRACRLLRRHALDDAMWAGASTREFGPFAGFGTLTTPGRAMSTYVANARAARLLAVQWHRLPAGTRRVRGGGGPGPREGTSMASCDGGNVSVLVGGWSDAWPAIRGDVWYVDHAPLTREEVAALQVAAHAAHAGGSAGRREDEAGAWADITAAADAALARAAVGVRGGAAGAAARQGAGQRPTSQPRGPAATGTTGIGLAWQRMGEAPRDAGDDGGGGGGGGGAAGGSARGAGGRGGRPMQPRYGHTATAVAHTSAGGAAAEAVLVLGGMTGGGYVGEMGDGFLLVPSVRIVAIRQPHDGGGSGGGGGDDDGLARSDAAPAAARGATAPASSYAAHSPLATSSFLVRRRVVADWADTRPATAPVFAPAAAADVGPEPPTGTDAASRAARQLWESARLAAAADAAAMRDGWARAAADGVRITPRGYHCATLVPTVGCVVVSGGIADGDSIWAPEVVDLATWATRPLETTGAGPSPRHGHSVTFLPPPGGAKASAALPAAAAPAALSAWRASASAPASASASSATTGAAAGSLGALFVFGGADGGDILRSGDSETAAVYRLDVATGAWTTPRLVSTPRLRTPLAGVLARHGRCHSATAGGAGDAIVLVGGGPDVCNGATVLRVHTCRACGGRGVDASGGHDGGGDDGGDGGGGSVDGGPGGGRGSTDADAAASSSGGGGDGCACAISVNVPDCVSALPPRPPAAGSGAAAASGGDLRDDAGAATIAAEPPRRRSVRLAAAAAAAPPTAGGGRDVVTDGPYAGRPVEPRRRRMPPRYNHCALRVGRALHIFGGWADGDALGDYWALDLAPPAVHGDCRGVDEEAAGGGGDAGGGDGNDAVDPQGGGGGDDDDDDDEDDEDDEDEDDDARQQRRRRNLQLQLQLMRRLVRGGVPRERRGGEGGGGDAGDEGAGGGACLAQ